VGLIFDGVWGIEQEIKFTENVWKEGHKFAVYFMLFLTELTILIKSVSNAINLLLMAEIALKCVNLNSAHKFHHLRVGNGKARERVGVFAARSHSAKSKK